MCFGLAKGLEVAAFQRQVPVPVSARGVEVLADRNKEAHVLIRRLANRRGEFNRATYRRSCDYLHHGFVICKW